MNEQKVLAALGAAEKVLHRVVCSRSGALAQQAREALDAVKAAQQDLADMRVLPTAQMALVMLVRVHLQRGLSVDQVRALLVCELRGKYGWTKGQANSRVSRAIKLAGVVSKMDEQTRQVKDAAGPDEEPGGSTVSLDFQVRAELQPRPCVLEFARVMERKLRENDWKGGWGELRPFELVGRLEQAVAELRRAMAQEAPANIFGQAVDVANYAMMVADLARGGTLGQQAAGEVPGVSHLLEDLRALAGSMGAACAEYSRAGSRAGLEHRVEEATIQCAMETVAGSCERAVRALIDKYGGRD